LQGCRRVSVVLIAAAIAVASATACNNPTLAAIREMSALEAESAVGPMADHLRSQGCGPTSSVTDVVRMRALFDKIRAASPNAPLMPSAVKAVANNDAWFSRCRDARTATSCDALAVSLAPKLALASDRTFAVAVEQGAETRCVARYDDAGKLVENYATIEMR
jgi:hypothetical protein